MGIDTKIEYCDSSGNLMAGCQGCELYNPKWTDDKNVCYAERLTRRHAGNKGWPEAFNKPKVFPERLKTIAGWSDLTGKDRPLKPWLNGYPRIVFLNDMGDTFTESLPEGWLDPYIMELRNSPHIYLLLTKRPKKMVTYFKESLGEVPDNFWLGTSVTSMAQIGRIDELAKISHMAKTWISFEPLRGSVMPSFIQEFDWIVAGGETGWRAEEMEAIWIYELIENCEALGIPFFFKNWGEQRAGRTFAGQEYNGIPRYQTPQERML
ncbi:DUF5131 family protein [Candidatus Pacearchaeota archaeon]|nr:DUF5131 family protein [Candidatus Pacearchaeota archaeon]